MNYVAGLGPNFAAFFLENVLTIFPFSAVFLGNLHAKFLISRGCIVVIAHLLVGGGTDLKYQLVCSKGQS